MNKQQKLIIIFSVLAIIIIATGAIFGRLRTKTPIQVNHPIDNPEYSQANIGTITYIGPQITIPQTLAVYKNTSSDISSFASQIASKFNIPLKSEQEKIWYNPTTNQAVFIDPYKGVIEYSLFTTTNQEETVNIQDQTSAQEIALEFLRSLGFSQNLNPDPLNINYYKDSFEFKETTPIDATIIEIVFEQAIDGVPVATETFTNTNISVWVENNTVIKSVFPPLITPTTHTQKPKLITFTQAVSVLENKQAKLISVNNIFGKTIENINLEDISISSAQVQYRLSEKTNLIYPYIEFSGSGRNTITQETVNVVFIVPLVNE